jgi:peptide/nickel transport system permease protein
LTGLLVLPRGLAKESVFPAPLARVAAFLAGFGRNRAAVVGALLVLMMTGLALAAPVLSPASQAGIGGAVMAAPSKAHPMGTDDLGRDVFHRFLYGARVSLSIGFLATFISAAIGVVIGLGAGYYGGVLDDGLMRATEAVQVAPRFILALIVAVLFGSSIGTLVLIIGLLSWPAIARLTRAEVLSVREQEFVLAARAIGASNWRIMTRAILPNAVTSAIVAGSLLVSQAILLESGLSFLGLGDPSAPSWGLMLNQAQPFLQTAWWLGVFPGLGIFLTSLGFNLMGDGLNDALNPRLRRR